MLMSSRQRAFVDGPACADGLFRSAAMNARRVIDSPLFPDCCDAEVAKEDGAAAGGCDDDPEAGAGAGGAHGAFFARGMITGRSDGASTECRNGERELDAHDAGGRDCIGGAAPAGSGGTAMETGGWLNVVGTDGPLLLPGVGTSCVSVSQGILELPDGMSGGAIESGDDACM